MIRRELLVPVSPARLWEELTDPDAVRSWFGGEVEWDLRPGGRVRVVEDDGTVRHGRVTTVAPERELRFRWWPEEDRSEGASEVTYRLVPDDDATRFEVTERRLSAPEASAGGRWTVWDTRLVGIWGAAALGCGAPTA